MNNKVVVHFTDGRVVHGETGDFFPNKATFHLKINGSSEIREIDNAQLKAIYFVQSFTGDKTYREDIRAERSGFGKKIRIQFRDSEVQYGYTQGYSPDRAGFSSHPAIRKATTCVFSFSPRQP